MDNISVTNKNLDMLKIRIVKEIENLRNEEYWGSEEQIKNENLIVKQSKVMMEDGETIEEYFKRII